MYFTIGNTFTIWAFSSLTRTVQQVLKTEPINIAPVKLIEKFNTFCQSVNAKVYSNGLENERLAEIRDMILPKLMSGAIDVSEIEV